MSNNIQPFGIFSGGFSLCLAGRFRSAGLFLFSVYANICGGTFRGSKAIFGGSPFVFSVRRCVPSVGFGFVMLSNGSNFACIAFCGFWWYSL